MSFLERAKTIENYENEVKVAGIKKDRELLKPLVDMFISAMTEINESGMTFQNSNYKGSFFSKTKFNDELLYMVTELTKAIENFGNFDCKLPNYMLYGNRYTEVSFKVNNNNPSIIVEHSFFNDVESTYEITNEDGMVKLVNDIIKQRVK